MRVFFPFFLSRHHINAHFYFVSACLWRLLRTSAAFNSFSPQTEHSPDGTPSNCAGRRLYQTILLAWCTTTLLRIQRSIGFQVQASGSGCWLSLPHSHICCVKTQAKADTFRVSWLHHGWKKEDWRFCSYKDQCLLGSNFQLPIITARGNSWLLQVSAIRSLSLCSEQNLKESQILSNS